MQSCFKNIKMNFCYKRGKTRNIYITRYSSKNKLLKYFLFYIGINYENIDLSFITIKLQPFNSYYKAYRKYCCSNKKT